MARTAQQARMDMAADQAARDMIARCHTCADGYRAIDRHFSAATVTGFARDIEGGMPWQFYQHWMNEAEQRLIGLGGAL